MPVIAAEAQRAACPWAGQQGGHDGCFAKGPWKSIGKRPGQGPGKVGTLVSAGRARGKGSFGKIAIISSDCTVFTLTRGTELCIEHTCLFAQTIFCADHLLRRLSFAQALHRLSFAQVISCGRLHRETFSWLRLQGGVFRKSASGSPLPGAMSASHPGRKICQTRNQPPAGAHLHKGLRAQLSGGLAPGSGDKGDKTCQRLY